jgi:hypothetical protein
MLSTRLSRTGLAAAVVAGCAAWVSAGVLAVLDAGHRVGVLSSPWLLVLCVAGAIGAAWVARLTADAAIPIFVLTLVIVPWLPVRVPDLFLVWVGPSIVLLWASAIFCGTVLIHASGGLPQRWLRDYRRAPYVAAALAFVVFVGVRSYRGGPPGGDEPHYLIIAQSILEDGDLTVGNNYDQQDYLSYWGGPITPHLGRPGRNGGRYSIHAPGVAAIVAPAFRIGGYAGAVIWIAMLVAFGSTLVWKAAYLLTKDAGSAWFGWCAVTITSPVVLHGSLIYPDPIGAVMIAAGTYALVVIAVHTRSGNSVEASPLSGWRWLWVGAAIGALPWLHTRLALPAAAMAFALLLRLAAMARGRAKWVSIAAFAIPIAVSITVWFAFFRIVYGTFNPSAPYGDQLPLDLLHVTRGLLGLIADQQFGLLPNAPIHILCGAGLWCLFRRDRRLTLELLLVIVPYVIASSGFPLWYGGGAPPSRFLVPVAFPFAVALAVLWARQDVPGRSMSLCLLGLSVIVAAMLSFGGDGTLAYNDNSGRAAWLDWIAPLVDLPRGFPSFFRADGTLNPRASAVVVQLVQPGLVWAVCGGTGWVVFRAIATRRTSFAVSVLAAPCCILAASATAVSITWRLSGGSALTSTRSQLRLLRNDDPRVRPLGVRLPALRTFSAGRARGQLALFTSVLDQPTRNTLLYLADVPSGTYKLGIHRRATANGTLVVRIGRGSGAAWEGALGDGSADALTLRLPVLSPTITVTGDENAMQSVDSVALVPEPRSASARASDERAWDAMRYGSLVVFATDDRIRLDHDGFWVLGERQPNVIVGLDRPTDVVDLALRNASISNRVRVSAGRWTIERVLAPDEEWRVRVPTAGSGYTFQLRFDVQSALPPQQGSLGCRVEFR